MRAGTAKKVSKWNVLGLMVAAAVLWTAGPIMAAGDECVGDEAGGCFSEGDAHGLTAGTPGGLNEADGVQSEWTELSALVESLLDWAEEVL